MLRLSWQERDGRRCFLVSGLPGELRRAAPGGERSLVFVPSEAARARGTTVQPMAGRVEVQGEDLLFIPRFAPSPGQRYSLLVRLDDANDYQAVAELTVPVLDAQPTTSVPGIHPQSGEVPVNLLKMYVEFSGPMSEGFAAAGIEVRRAEDGQPLTDVFRLDPELWDARHQRLTLLLDPARIKRGLINNLESGYPLEEGAPVVVSVTQAMRDAAGQPLVSRASRSYRVGPPLRRRVDPSEWRIEVPTAGTVQALIVEFGQPLDHALVVHCLGVGRPNGEFVHGEGTPLDADRAWQFRPVDPWPQGVFRLVVDPRLEDLAGNSVVRVFDRDLDDRGDDPAAAEVRTIPFEVRETHRGP